MELRQRVLELYAQGYGCSRIHKKTGASKNSISRWVKGSGIQRVCKYQQELKESQAQKALHRQRRAMLKALRRRIASLKPKKKYVYDRRGDYQSNRTEALFRSKAYYQANKHRINANPVLRIRKSLRLRVHKLVRGYKGKSALLGCTSAQLRVWLELKFQPGMSWENCGKAWHVDHRTPLASVDLFDPEQLARVAHYTNLQPLSVRDNRAKGARVDWVPGAN